jgi:hypothetical protein
VHAARAGLTIGGAPVTPLVPRMILQVFFLAAVLVAGFGRRLWRSRLPSRFESAGARP